MKDGASSGKPSGDGRSQDDSGSITANLAVVKSRIERAAKRGGVDPADVRLIAVSKTKPASAVLEAYRAGQRLFGENRVQEALGKMAETGPGPEWHLIGHLQTNKARLVTQGFAMVHAVDSDRIAKALEEQAAKKGTTLKVLIQVNWQAEDTKTGVTDAPQLLRLTEIVRGCIHLELKGLMTIPRAGMNETETRGLYATIRRLHADVKSRFALGEGFRELSMGMSHDFEWAVEEGATLVRVGTAIFGARS